MLEHRRLEEDRQRVEAQRRLAADTYNPLTDPHLNDNHSFGLDDDDAFTDDELEQRRGGDGRDAPEVDEAVRARAEHELVVEAVEGDLPHLRCRVPL